MIVHRAITHSREYAECIKNRKKKQNKKNIAVHEINEVELDPIFLLFPNEK